MPIISFVVIFSLLVESVTTETSAEAELLFAVVKLIGVVVIFGAVVGCVARVVKAEALVLVPAVTLIGVVIFDAEEG